MSVLDSLRRPILDSRGKLYVDGLRVDGVIQQGTIWDIDEDGDICCRFEDGFEYLELSFDPDDWAELVAFIERKRAEVMG